MAPDKTLTKQHSSPKVLIIGGGYAGALAALRLAGRARRARVGVRVTLVNGAADFVERVRLHELGAGRAPKRIALADLLRNTGVELVVGWAERIDPEAREVEVVDARGERTRLSYDRLVDATGSTVAVEQLPGASAHAFALSGADEARRLARRLAEAPSGARVVVVGGGLTAIEAAAEIAELHPRLEVCLATRDELGADLSPRGRDYLLRALGALGVHIREHTRAVEVQPDGLAVRGPGLSALARIEADVVVMAAGFVPSRLAARSGLSTTAEGRVLVDDRLRVVGQEAIWAAGDAAATPGADGPLRMSCATAMPQAAYVADDVLASLTGADHAPFAFGFLLRCISLGRRRGLVQMVDGRDVPRDTVLTGRLGAWFKEAVVRFTVLALRFERLLPGSYRWPEGPRVNRAALPAES